MLKFIIYIDQWYYKISLPLTHWRQWLCYNHFTLDILRKRCDVNHKLFKHNALPIYTAWHHPQTVCSNWICLTILCSRIYVFYCVSNNSNNETIIYWKVKKTCFDIFYFTTTKIVFHGLIFNICNAKEWHSSTLPPCIVLERL